MPQTIHTLPKRLGIALTRWLDSAAGGELSDDDERIDWVRTLPFIALHLACVTVIWVGISRFAVAVALGLYALRMFALTGFYHRYFSHRAFRTSRLTQFIFAAIGACCVQRGPLWWAAHHRNHHRFADTERDPHSPVWKGFFRSHMGWFLTPRAFRTDLKVIRDLTCYPELRLLDRFDILMPTVMGLALYLLGSYLHSRHSALHTSGPQLLVWGLCISTVALFHATFMINSLAHRFGSRRFDLRDASRNNWWLAILTFGEGWHNNHHRYPGSARQGLYWWEWDLTFYGLTILSWLGLVSDLRQQPVSVRPTHASVRRSGLS